MEAADDEMIRDSFEAYQPGIYTHVTLTAVWAANVLKLNSKCINTVHTLSLLIHISSHIFIRACI